MLRGQIDPTFWSGNLEFQVRGKMANLSTSVDRMANFGVRDRFVDSIGAVEVKILNSAYYRIFVPKLLLESKKKSERLHIRPIFFARNLRDENVGLDEEGKCTGKNQNWHVRVDQLTCEVRYWRSFMGAARTGCVQFSL